MKTLEKVSSFVGRTFSLWVLLFACFGFFAPQLFTGHKAWITPMLGIVMFGMGLTLSAADFREVFRRPKDVAIGVVGHYLIMPGIAYVLAVAAALEEMLADDPRTARPVPDIGKLKAAGPISAMEGFLGFD